jgi:hypothetical protein
MSKDHFCDIYICWGLHYKIKGHTKSISASLRWTGGLDLVVVILISFYSSSVRSMARSCPHGRMVSAVSAPLATDPSSRRPSLRAGAFIEEAATPGAQQQPHPTPAAACARHPATSSSSRTPRAGPSSSACMVPARVRARGSTLAAGHHRARGRRSNPLLPPPPRHSGQILQARCSALAPPRRARWPRQLLHDGL